MILLDDAQSTAALPTSRLYENALHYWRVLPSGDHDLDLAATQKCLSEISTALAKGEYVVAAFAYELGQQIHKLATRTNRIANPHPLIEAWSFSGFKKFSKRDVDQWIAQKLTLLEASEQNAGVINVRTSVTEAEFTR